jgi:predicted short-subunit dehydrogenase-like oxidoreductase (DUF2520 family)
MRRICIIGAGRVGTAFAHALRSRGYHIACVISKTRKSARSLAKEVNASVCSTELADIPSDVGTIIIAVPDQAMPGLVSALSHLKKLDFSHVFVVHTSGIHRSDILKPLSRRGAKVAAIHPIQTFVRQKKVHRQKTLLQDIYYGIEAPQNALMSAKRLVKTLGGSYIIVPAELKPLYHALCVFSSGYVVTILGTIEVMSKQLHLKKRWDIVFGPLLRTAIRNAIELSPSSALTGPFVRGDVATVKQHLRCLRKSAPDYIELYRALGMASLSLTDKGHPTPPKISKELRTLLDQAK